MISSFVCPPPRYFVVSFFFVRFRGVFQYGEWQRAQTFGSMSGLRDTHSLPHRSHFQPHTFTLPMLEVWHHNDSMSST
jgi:hypothetical protein